MSRQHPSFFLLIIFSMFLFAGAFLCPRTLYAEESRYDDPTLRENILESLCAETRTVFYTNISRIKKKFVDALGARRASGYIIKRSKTGLYRTRALLCTTETDKQALRPPSSPASSDI